ncbi:KpsF/GutQ family sugar-phosphate isomerase [Pleomorphomonas diazotrophica]|uniref:KpsF/GutQ family sugar-phosphate isomerase n=1 Tax=Pleomorphomonas diazotrophica TaxID=1166257 RepID=A0A1I4QYI1_9HYPH|nr:KpsF/GutQ family sugar-phosphate isomerase [Pleomorphomonas diazotrophica]PKR90328.1 KpsF/GutQ family sugar-phosphate isomerase [Pleomorphomonas diazotrophica]SFM45114.1 arabinose-5-phosphate isomerase [Pleomorphomonas diazotrophica]
MTDSPLPKPALAAALHAIEITRTGIAALEEAALHGPLGEAIDKAIGIVAEGKGRLIVTGIGKSGHIARKLAATFSSTGTAAYYVHPTEAGHGDLGMVDGSDVILALSWSGETTELAVVLAFAKRFDVPVIALTAGAESTLAAAADVALILPRVREACPHNLAPTTSTVLQLAIGDAIAMGVMVRRGFSETDFHIFHPGGKLGSQLRRVSDIMHTERLPLIAADSRMTDAILAISSGGFGVVGVVDGDGHLIGIVTDGDLRRFVHSDLGPQLSASKLETPVAQVMTRKPITVAPQIFAAEALDLLQNRKISVLFVVENEKPIGILHTLDLLRIGVA